MGRHTVSLRIARALLFGLALGCSDSPVGPSTNGPQLFSAKLNGVQWTATDSSRMQSLWDSEGNLLIAGDRLGPIYPPIIDRVEVRAIVTGKGPYALGDSMFFGLYHVTASNIFYFTSPAHPGVLRVTAVDRKSQTIAGTFSFDGQRSWDSAIVHVTDGKFRLHYLIP